MGMYVGEAEAAYEVATQLMLLSELSSLPILVPVATASSWSMATR